MKCRTCNTQTSVFLDLSHIPISVTSDCRIVDIGVKLYICDSCSLIQKDSTPLMQENYFSEFCSHSISNGEEQVKFINGIAIPRSELVVTKIKEYIPAKGKVLDIGTGNGSFLKAYKKFFKNWNLHAQDIQSNSKEDILKIVPEENIYIKEISKIDQGFDMLSIIGVLGHIPNLKQFLLDLTKLQNKNGKIIIQTPDLQKSFFDVVVVDHITYFSKAHLLKIMSKYFKNISFFDIVHKEITLGVNFSNKNEELDFDKEQEDILEQAEIFKKIVSFLDTTKDSFIVFGTAPVSTYIGAILEDKLLSFVDEDEVRIGNMHLNKLISHPKDADENQMIFLPFVQKDIINSIEKKFPSLNFFSYEDI